MARVEIDHSLLKSLVLTPGAPGYEDRVRELILEKVRGTGKASVDRVGNLVLELGGSGPRIVIAAHMDEISLLVTGIDQDGKLAFRKLGGIDDALLPSRHVEVHTRNGPVPGVIGALPPHLRNLTGGSDKPEPWHKLRIDIGAETREEALELGVRPLDPVTPVKHYALLARGKYVATRALDDRAGCASLVQLARLVARGDLEPRAELVLAWTVQEEVGLRGARALARRLEPDLFIAVDTMTCCHPAVTGQTRLGGGPVIRAVDNVHIAPPRVVRGLQALAESAGIPVQVSTAGGGTDAAAFQLEGIPSVAVTIPVNYTHSMVEKMRVSDYENLIRLLAEAARRPEFF